jgi:hypothetical protein
VARRADQEIGDQKSSTSMFYTPNVMDQMKQYWPVLLLIVILGIIYWKYGLKKL